MISIAHFQSSIVGEETLAFVEIKSPSVNLHLSSWVCHQSSPLLNTFLKTLRNGFRHFVIIERNAFKLLECTIHHLHLL